MKIIRITLLAAAVLGSSLLRAQPVPVQQFGEQQRQQSRVRDALKPSVVSTNVAELYPGENDDVGPQQILQLNERRTHFEALIDSQYIYTDNNRLTENNKIATGLAINTAQFALAPTPYKLGPGQFAPRVGIRSQWYNYGLGGESSEDVLDFNAQSAFVGALFQYEQKWDFAGLVEYNRLLDQKEYNEFYKEFTTSLGVQRYFMLRENMMFAVGWLGMYHFTDVDPTPRRDVNDRLDNTLALTLSYQPVDKLILQPLYRLQYTYYPRTVFGDSRNDLFNIFGGSVSYYFTRQIVGRVYGTYTMRETDDAFTPSYRKLDGGLGGSVIFRF